MRYRVSHRTEYSYDKSVSGSLGVFHLHPRQLPWQDVSSHTVTIDPAAHDRASDVDYFGNSATFFHVLEPHRRLSVEAVTDVAVEVPRYDDTALAMAWEDARPLAHPRLPGAWAATEYALESPKVAQVAAAVEYGIPSLTRRRPIGEAVTDLMHRIHEDFDYDTKATTVTSTVAEAMRKRAGVCQDFAHLALACLRGHGLAARYVSGYLATRPAPGKDRVIGADASHAWIAVWLPASDQWLAIDPTNDQWANDRYVTVAWGRDYGDVSPLRGVIFSKAKKSTLRVSVDVAPWHEARPLSHAPST